MASIVWVFGNPAVGKESFIRRTASGQVPSVPPFLASGKKISVIEESLTWVSYKLNPEFLEQRGTIPDLVAKRSEAWDPDSAIIIKGQFSDLESGAPQKLMQLLPEAKHVIIHVRAPDETVYERLKQKPWYKDYFELDRVKRLHEYEISLLNKLPTGFDRYIVQSNDDFKYEFSTITGDF
jgi:hypothetical protein